MPEFLDHLHRTIVSSTFVAAFMLNLLRRIVPPLRPPPSATCAPPVCNAAHPYCSFCAARRIAAFASSFGDSAEKLQSCFGRSASCSACRMRCFAVAVVRFSRHCTTHLLSRHQHLNRACVRTCLRDSLCISSPHGCSSLLLLRFSCKLRCRSANSLP